MNTKKHLINNTLSTLKNLNGFSVIFYPPANPIDIIDFENSLKKKLPADYKYFLLNTNGLSVANNSIFGVYGKNCKMKNMSIEGIYDFEHFESCNPMPNHLVPFCPDGYGNHYCFDLIKDNIVFWEWDCDYSEGDPVVAYYSLGELLQEIFIDWTLDFE